MFPQCQCLEKWDCRKNFSQKIFFLHFTRTKNFCPQPKIVGLFFLWVLWTKLLSTEFVFSLPSQYQYVSVFADPTLTMIVDLYLQPSAFPWKQEENEPFFIFGVFFCCCWKSTSWPSSFVSEQRSNKLPKSKLQKRSWLY